MRWAVSFMSWCATTSSNSLCDASPSISTARSSVPAGRSRGRSADNPHHPKDPSYYPLLAHLAETGQILRLKNRPGNVVDSTGAGAFVRDLVGALRARFGRSMPLDFRTDAAFFKADMLKPLDRLGCDFSVKVPFWKWLGL